MIKTVNDFLPQLQEMYPDIPLQDIKRAVEYGFRQLYYYNLRGLDTLIQSQKSKYWMYCGKLTSNSLRHFEHYKIQLCRKFRALYNKKCPVWDNYYYFGLTNEEYEDFIKPRKGRPKKKFSFIHKVIYKIPDEARVRYSWSKCILQIEVPALVGYSFYQETLKCISPKIVFTRERPATFEDILVTENKYDLI